MIIMALSYVNRTGDVSQITRYASPSEVFRASQD